MALTRRGGGGVRGRGLLAAAHGAGVRAGGGRAAALLKIAERGGQQAAARDHLPQGVDGLLPPAHQLGHGARRLLRGHSRLAQPARPEQPRLLHAALVAHRRGHRPAPLPDWRGKQHDRCRGAAAGHHRARAAHLARSGRDHRARLALPARRDADLESRRIPVSCYPPPCDATHP